MLNTSPLHVDSVSMSAVGENSTVGVVFGVVSSRSFSAILVVLLEQTPGG